MDDLPGDDSDGGATSQPVTRRTLLTDGGNNDVLGDASR
jgi:hypothetical protein